jgi:hypothetical protein
MSVATKSPYNKRPPQNDHCIIESILSDRMGYTSACFQQQSNTPQQKLYAIETPISINEEQFDNKRLIQAATNRLRQKNLEREYQAFKSRIVEIQSQLEVIKLDTTISLNLLPNEIDENQLCFFEKRLMKHKTQLQQLLKLSHAEATTAKTNETTGTNLTSKVISSSLSSLSKSSFSSISSLLSLSFNKQPEEDSDYYSILGGSILNHQKRRKRKHQQLQKMQAQEPTVDSSEAASSLYHAENLAQPSLSSPSSAFMESSDIGTKELLVLHSIQPSKDELIKRNALDDTLSFINELKSDTDDGGFKQDIYNMISDMITKATIDPYAVYPTFISPPLPDILDDHPSLLERCISTGWRWFRFAIVMTLAIMINIKKGPQSFLHHQHGYNHFTSCY